MEILTEFDELQAALAKVNMNESVLPYVNGRLVDSDAYNKTQKILNCPEMISAHKRLYELDMDQLTEEDEEMIDKLYKLGCDRGFIIDDLTKWDDDGNEEQAEEQVNVVADDAVPAKPQNTLFKAKVPCWTVIYSATKDGDIKTGEAYSNAISASAAKADVNAKLSQCGYDNITILAIENCVNAPAAYASAEVEQVDMNEADDEQSDEDTSDEDTSDDAEASDDGSDEESSGKDDAEEDDSNKSDEDTSDDGSDEDTSDDSNEDASNDSSDEDASDDDSDEDTDEESSDKDDEDTSDDDSDEDSSDKDDEDKELDANEKAELKSLYRKTFKNTLVKCKFDTSFNDLTIEQKVKFFTELAKAWKKDYEPNEFMTDKELEQLDNVVASSEAGSDEDEDNEEPSDKD